MSKGKAKPVPEGYHTVTPYLIVDGAAKALDFYGTCLRRHRAHADAGPRRQGRPRRDQHRRLGHHARGRASRDGRARPAGIWRRAVSLHLYVPDVDATVKKAVAAGAKLLRPVEDKFYGDRMGTIEDPFGHHWHVSTHQEDVSPDEMARRAAAASKPS